ncbi:hypothetical protein [Bartonella sp. OT172YNZD]
MFSFTNAQGITKTLHGIWHRRYGTTRCSAHDDRLPSLSLINGTINKT